ncbi:ribose 5-phosphate isomerase B [candidate division WOR-1 bacterium RIFOXYA12_FULL_43_27]|uniref:Ribose 5-phosphate isomerase B n=1 Tax=candidate division WOR-1 bacterium RIFOXYC2_FULL_46_14 TaxID=1802587 RepID=A0A1F4U7F9_UNCSA|nr:MAG: ribose 5-phosphate isomerase B [candidate division WOR-1 bacterium RIFOXYA12_FULL_43_27]OGC20387.1 MAG: ribose 5-phosphate isomerase B [candidate division WOR-1 bacterium RIFOXYB2_FULL_46_45]OGC31876.1 MAG: ribose 5-phosphate isomerase B [candidate division WOR-1 bacterium RIFOXYA2_FULL_46_56]OGC40233.1 MAG: ribose 5-phosphate isomerase B [candidate division WOR-1 bacterium RIFOXYC2_FULL_46_14]
MKIAMASDHAGYKLKEDLKKFLARKKHEVIDFGTNSEESCDYPDFARPAAEAVAKGVADRGILICGSGVGVTIVANKVVGIRAALAHNTYIAKQSRQHGDVNILTLAGRKVTRAKAHRIVDVWLKTEFSGDERHLRRIRKIEQ